MIGCREFLSSCQAESKSYASLTFKLSQHSKLPSVFSLTLSKCTFGNAIFFSVTAMDAVYALKCQDRTLYELGGQVSKESVVLHRWESTIRSFGIINWVDNVNWPPLMKDSIWRRANARNVRFETLSGGQVMLSTVRDPVTVTEKINEKLTVTVLLQPEIPLQRHWEKGRETDNDIYIDSNRNKCSIAIQETAIVRAMMKERTIETYPKTGVFPQILTLTLTLVLTITITMAR